MSHLAKISWRFGDFFDHDLSILSSYLNDFLMVVFFFCEGVVCFCLMVV
jgi:hypothetical protein